MDNIHNGHIHITQVPELTVNYFLIINCKSMLIKDVRKRNFFSQIHRYERLHMTSACECEMQNFASICKIL